MEEEIKWKRREAGRRERAIKASRPVIITVAYNTHAYIRSIIYIYIYIILSLFQCKS